jgi:hypothetical protein
MKLPFRIGAGLLGVAGVAAVAFLSDHMLDAYGRDRFVREGSRAGPVRVTDFGPLPDELDESSGLAASIAHPGVFWSHNDSGDEPRLYAVDTTATLISTVNVGGARAVDWEALDIGACPLEGEPPDAWCLYVADTGNNARRRRTVSIYVVPEPDPRAERGSVDALGAVRFSYADGPTDAEAIAITAEGDLIVVTKWGAPRVVLHRIPAVDVRRALSGGDTLRLGPGRELPIRSDFMLGGVVTGAALDGDEAILAVRTYSELYFFAWPLTVSVLEGAPRCFLGGLQVQGEAVDLLPDGRALLSSESPGGASSRLLAVACAGVAE